jgi:hypothetical protein
MRTVLHGQRMHRYAFDQGEISRDPQRTNETSPNAAGQGSGILSPEIMALLSGKLSAGEIAQLAALVAQARFGASAYEAAASEGDPRAAPTPWVQEDQPPPFPGRPHRSSRATDATFMPMATGRDVQPNARGRLTMPRVATDGLLRWETDEAEIRQRLALSDMKRAAQASARLESRFPGFSRLRRAF